ncbi:cysteine hydrolase family protein [Metabacillus iocasae]|uniref:Nicotinamidase-related amidase n=1 Tax=Priestia iocasae TaxID=2291674 RepID=A0ABS2QWB2_9BACI|nr:cysteine hydrolase family protein [Metabacillus iocasae]MBM7703765.1 nicotinamidase-related amidase [Metabacillus iocasae]
MTKSRPLLLVIDVQKGFNHTAWGSRNNKHAETNMLTLLQTWRHKDYPIIHVQHASKSPDSPLHPSTLGFQFKDGFGPIEDEYLIRKQQNSCFIGTELDNYLKSNGYDTLILVGLTTNHCVSTTARMAGNLGYRTYVVHDATACFELVSYDRTKHYEAEEVHQLSLSSLHGEFATVVSTEEVLQVINSFEMQNSKK